MGSIKESMDFGAHESWSSDRSCFSWTLLRKAWVWQPRSSGAPSNRISFEFYLQNDWFCKSGHLELRKVMFLIDSLKKSMDLEARELWSFDTLCFSFFLVRKPWIWEFSSSGALTSRVCNVFYCGKIDFGSSWALDLRQVMLLMDSVDNSMDFGAHELCSSDKSCSS